MAYLVTRDTGLTPWALGKPISRRRFSLAASVLAPVFTLTPLYMNFAALRKAGTCPLLGA